MVIERPAFARRYVHLQGHVSVSSSQTRASFWSALNIHLAQHPPRTPCHGKKCNVRSEDRALQGPAARKGNPRGSRQGDEKDASNDRRHGDCSQWSSKGQCSRGDTCTLKHDLNKIKKVWEKEIPKESDPKVPVQQESRKSWCATIFRGGPHPHAIGTHQHVHTTKGNASDDKNDDATVAIKLEEPKEFHCVACHLHMLVTSHFALHPPNRNRFRSNLSKTRKQP